MSNEPKNYTVLIVDDEEILRDTIAFDFKRKGFNVLCAENGVAAYQLVLGNRVDLVISDLRMPNGDGLGLLTSIREGGLASPPKVIFITGFADTSNQDCIEKGAFRVICKPFERKQLMGSAFEALGIPVPS